jgi:hypothetical protein
VRDSACWLAGQVSLEEPRNLERNCRASKCDITRGVCPSPVEQQTLRRDIGSALLRLKL